MGDVSDEHARGTRTPGRAPSLEDSGLRPSLVDRLTVLQRQAARGLAAVLSEDGCTLDQWRVLRALADGQGRPMGDLADAVQIPAATLTRVADGLADAGLVYRRQPDDDRRRVRVHLSRLGRSRLAGLEALVEAHESALRHSEEWEPVRLELLGLLASRAPAYDL